MQTDILCIENGACIDAKLLMNYYEEVLNIGIGRLVTKTETWYH